MTASIQDSALSERVTLLAAEIIELAVDWRHATLGAPLPADTQEARLAAAAEACRLLRQR